MARVVGSLWSENSSGPTGWGLFHPAAFIGGWSSSRVGYGCDILCSVVGWLSAGGIGMGRFLFGVGLSVLDWGHLVVHDRSFVAAQPLCP